MSRIFLLLLAALKFGKLVPTVLSLVFAVGVYTLVFGWRYAVGIVAMLLIHEMGHYIAARHRGLKVRLPMFIPFVFAWTTLEDLPHDAETEAYIGLGGPMLGTVGAIGAWWLAQSTDATWLLAVASTGFFLNLINLIPLPPLDGGRITTVLSPRIWLLGVPIIGILLWYQFSIILLLIAILALPHVIAAFRFDPSSSPEAQRYHDVSARTRWEYGLIYVGLIAFLAYMTNDLHRELRGVRSQDIEQRQSSDV